MNQTTLVENLRASVIASLTKLRTSSVEEDVGQYMHIMSHIHFVDADLHTKLNAELSKTGWRAIPVVNEPPSDETKVPEEEEVNHLTVQVPNNANNAGSQAGTLGTPWTSSSRDSVGSVGSLNLGSVNQLRSGQQTPVSPPKKNNA
jgi:hypothetical protein